MARLFFASLLAVAMGGCSESTDAALSDSGVPLDAHATPTCVAYDGPPSDGWLTVDGTGVGESFPSCAPRCGAATAFDGFPRAEALPTGSCSGSTTCDLGAVPRCGCTEDRGPVNHYRCTCTSGSWSCRIVVQGGSICRASCPDAATPDTAGTCPPLTGCTGTSLPVEVFAFDPDAKCRSCATATLCAPDGCGAAPDCLVHVATGRLHWAAYSCGPTVSAAAGFRACTTAERTTMGATWPPPPFCSSVPDAGGDVGPCGAGKHVAYATPGCSAEPTCLPDGPEDACASTFCGCDGKTFFGACGYSPRPFASVGACADAGDGG